MAAVAHFRFMFLAVWISVLIVGCLPTATQIPVGSSTYAAHVPTAEMSPTVRATLAADSRLRYVSQLLQTNSNCRLPCWWGIMPGDTTWAETREFLAYLGLQTGDQPESDGSTYHGTGGLDFSSNGIFNRLGFYDRQGVIERILVSGEGYEDKPFFYRLWKTYSPERLVAAYGTPTRVVTMLFGSEQGTEFYYLLFFYDNQGVLLAYKGTAEPVTEGGTVLYRVCPAWKDQDWLPEVKIYLQNPGSKNTLDQLGNVDHGYMPLTEISSVNVDAFVSSLRDAAPSACFETPASSWP